MATTRNDAAGKKRAWGGLILRLSIMALLVGAALWVVADTPSRALINVSYDPTREFYADFDAAFTAAWKRETDQTVVIRSLHGGSGAQADSVIAGEEADVVTLALAQDIDKLSAAGLVAKGWQARLPYDSSPYTSTIVFLVRKGNPKAITDWADLLRPGVGVVTANPKTSGGGRWAFLAAWAWAARAAANGEDPDRAAEAYVSALYRQVVALDDGARGATLSFTEGGLGDVLLAWENEAFLAIEEHGDEADGGFEIVVPSLSILAQPTVAVVDHNVDRHETRPLAEAYLAYLYSPDGQRLAARHHYRPLRPEQADWDDRARFASLRLVTVGEAFGGWKAAQPRFFDDGGVFDRIHAAIGPLPLKD
ncbi:sulfate transporter subunit [Rhodospirillum rubrum]|uniref:sulfate ABC transporter substrate-binding protein n=1 Tax=Rhodospirillum rubrum TaxID=1085 RepID=UPI001903D953|nr:sulfate ABC transporter substrate-binding protein [Rhodospirillum rubrum]MBK1664631.1 sulfate transporter subunit [Rhodospirillum rubrum]MBK1676312.1 sulfate transporter subunit [Rhodospirillum rubrum]